MLTRTHKLISLALASATCVVALFTFAATAAAHIQVSPTKAAPNDAVKFAVLVPGERPPNKTVKVELAVPDGVLPYSFDDPPGWTRRIVKASNGATGRIVWTGSLPADGFAEFSFLASTPPKPTILTWKALQTYSDGEIVRWIGSPDSEEPAPTTDIVAGAPLQNAGGESANGKKSAAAGADSTNSESSSADNTSRALAIVAIALAAAALAVALLKRRKQHG